MQATKYLKDVTVQKQMCAILSLEWWSWYVCPSHRVGEDAGSMTKKSAEFFLHVLKNAESNPELRGLDVGSLVIEHIQLNKA